MSAPEIAALRAAGYHVERQGTYDNRMKRLAVLESQLRWAEDEKEHHEKWLSGILAESRRLQDRFNRITAALAVSGVEWSVIAGLLGDEPPTPLSPADCACLHNPKGHCTEHWTTPTSPGDPEPCHCGKPVTFGYDGDPTHHRGMCEHCDLVRCDAYPGACVTSPGSGQGDA